MTTITHRTSNPTATGRPATGTAAEVTVSRPVSTTASISLALLRIGLGLIFFWAFLDKAFGFGYSTPAARAWIKSPTAGFLGHVESGPLGRHRGERRRRRDRHDGTDVAG